MRILLVHPHEVFSKFEPWTIRIISFGNEFVKKGHEVKIAYFPLEWNKALKNFTKGGIEFIPLKRRAGIFNIAENCFKLNKLAKWSDIVHFQKCFHYASLPSLVAGFLNNKPIHYDWDDWEEMIYYESARFPVKGIGLFLRKLERILPGMASTVSVSSKHIYELCISLGVSAERIFHVPVGADLEVFNPCISGEKVRKLHNINYPLVLYVGQLHGGQYVKLFIEAAKTVLKRGIKANFMIVGDGVRISELKQRVNDLGLKDQVIFTGAVEAARVPEYMASCDIAIACFEDNNVTRCKSPLKIAEYLASGKPIIASKVGEVGQMVAGAGILVEPGRSYPLAESIIFLLSNKLLQEEMGRKARERAEKIYNWKTSAETLLHAYDAALSKN
ncbi:glycosyltransferase WbuB [bacterium]|nr:MAG: glycosyltransferase WbuB [bacterium]